LARLNEIVISTFGILFTPTVARFFAKRQHVAIDDLYWQTATWITALSFPIFATCFAFSEPLTVFMFGEEYASSAPVLVFLSLGFYGNAIFGFNVHTLRVYGCVRFLVVSDLVAMAFVIVANLLLIPRYGIWGAAVAVSLTQLLQNLINQYGLMLQTSVRPFPRRCLGTYVAVVLSIGVLVQVQRLWEPPLLLALCYTAVATMVVIGVSRKQLDLTNTIPQLARFPLLARVIG
jgi:O-antigen/teichoic acid export membrane protein